MLTALNTAMFLSLVAALTARALLATQRAGVTQSRYAMQATLALAPRQLQPS
jgi:hypothetical protein